MSYIMYKGKKYSSLNSKNISFDNSNSNLESSNVEDSIKELNIISNSKANIEHYHDIYAYTVHSHDDYSTIYHEHPLPNIEIGECAPWNVSITEQLCYKFGKICIIRVRGTCDRMYSSMSLFALPWIPKGIYSGSDVAVLYGWTADNNPTPLFSSYNSQYNLISIGQAEYDYKNFSFFTIYCTE